MAQFNLTYYKNEDKYSDGDIEDKILYMAEHGIGLDDINPEDCEFPVLYHLSEERGNILRWYPFKEKSRILEIGAGPGAISGTLCNRAEKVVSVELSKHRAMINYYRHKDLDNLEIMVGNLNDMSFEEQFDYVVLNGVYEYAMSFTEGDKPYETFINNISKFLKHDGIILIAIENRLGLKYFAGAPEDHTDCYFLGLNEYEGNNTVRTFTKKEITSILLNCGFDKTRFYYPYPDYKFPKEIFTDETIGNMGYGRDYYNFTTRFSLFNEPKVAQTLASEGVASTFANSFLVECSRKELEEEGHVIYSKFGSDRKKEYRIMTSIVKENNKLVVYKSGIDSTRTNHLEQLSKHEQENLNEKLKPLVGEWTDNGLRYKYLHEKTFEQIIREKMQINDKASIYSVLDDLFNDALYVDAFENDYLTNEFIKVFGETALNETKVKCIQPANIDLLCSNIFCNGDGYSVIDGEWIFDFPVPVDFIIWRNIEELYNKIGYLNNVIPKDEMLQHFCIDKERQITFVSWNRHFVYKYVGAEKLEWYSNRKLSISLEEEVRKSNGDKTITSSLYVDTGMGFSETNKISQSVEYRDGCFEFEFDLSEYQNVKQLRFDPVEQKYSICHAEVFDGIMWKKLMPDNANGKKDKGYLFLTKDPMFIFAKKDKKDVVKIRGWIKYLSEDDLVDMMR